jgi:hypothetical protein
MSTLYWCRWPDRPSKSRSTWKPVPRSPLARTDAHGGLPALRMADQVVGLEHHLAEAGVLHRLQLGLQRAGQRDGVHAEAGDGLAQAARVVHAARSSCTSSNTTPPR